MIRRRDLFIGAACLAASGSAFALQPRRRVSLLGSARVDQIVPTTVGDWSSHPVDDLVAPDQGDDGAAELYDEIVERIYQQGSTGAEIMMLMAHGQSQTTHLQVHRPEDCYPAFGFAVSDKRSAELPLASGVALPAVLLVADAPGRRENIVYWTRLGEFLPIQRRRRTGGSDENRSWRLHRRWASGAVFGRGETDGDAALATINGFIPSAHPRGQRRSSRRAYRDRARQCVD